MQTKYSKTRHVNILTADQFEISRGLMEQEAAATGHSLTRENISLASPTEV